jgi:hypothetical protein
MLTSSTRPTGPAGFTPEYAELRPRLALGDVVLYGGDTPQCRRLKAMMRSRWSHVAMVVRLEGDEGPLLWEATGASGMADLVSESEDGGVHLVRLEDWANKYGGDIAVRQLTVERLAGFFAAFRAFFEQVHGRPYEQTRTQTIRACFKSFFLRNRREDLSSLFCSELVAATYQRLGLLPMEPPSNTYTPRDFGAEGKLPLREGAALGEEVMIHW